MWQKKEEVWVATVQDITAGASKGQCAIVTLHPAIKLSDPARWWRRMRMEVRIRRREDPEIYLHTMEADVHHAAPSPQN